MLTRHLVTTLVVVLLAACDSAPPAASYPPDDPPAGNTELLDSVRQPLDRADSVNDLSLGRKDQLDEAVESGEAE